MKKKESTIKISPSTHAKLLKAKKKSGVSIKRLVDSAVDIMIKSVRQEGGIL